MENIDVSKGWSLNEEQQEAFYKIHADKYGSSKAFLGMVSNQHVEFERPFEELLKMNLDIQIKAQKTFDEIQEKKKKEVKKGDSAVKKSFV